MEEEAVTQANFQTPVEIREYLQRSIGQARGAFEAFSRAAKSAVSSIDSTLPAGVKEASDKAFQARGGSPTQCRLRAIHCQHVSLQLER